MLESRKMLLSRLLLIGLIFSIGCNSQSNLNGTWLQVSENHYAFDTVSIHDNFDPNETIYTIKIDSGYVNHYYRNDSLIAINSIIKQIFVKIDLDRGLISFYEKDSSTNELETTIEFFENHKMKIKDNFILTADGDTITFNLADKELALNGISYYLVD